MFYRFKATVTSSLPEVVISQGKLSAKNGSLAFRGAVRAAILDSCNGEIDPLYWEQPSVVTIYLARLEATSEASNPVRVIMALDTDVIVFRDTVEGEQVQILAAEEL